MKNNRYVVAISCIFCLVSIEVKATATINWNDHARWNGGKEVPLTVWFSDGRRTEVPVGDKLTISEPATLYHQVLDAAGEHLPITPKPHVRISFCKLNGIRKEDVLIGALVGIGNPRKRIVLVDLQYPYGKKKVYMSGSLVSVAAECCGFPNTEVDIVDFNLESVSEPRVRDLLTKANIIGVSVVGSPYFPQTVDFCQFAAQNYPNATVVLGGQVIRSLTADEFRRIFGKRAIQIASNEGWQAVFGHQPGGFGQIEPSLQPVWEHMGDERLQKYLEHEFPLILSQGCVFNCHFCAADKNRKEEHRRLDLFESDLLFLMSKAKAFGLCRLECYATALDFFQNPTTVAQHMQVIAEVSRQSGIAIKVRALCCMSTFLKASRTIQGFAELVRDSGLWCVGFGVDGPNREVWKKQNKLQNDAQGIVDCLNLCQELGVRSEVLMIMGYPNNTPAELAATVRDCYRYIQRWPNTVLRPYLAKTLLPGNLGWDIQPAQVERLIADPRQFYNLDLCALGSPVTHPCWWQRWLANLSYLSVVAGSVPFGRCASSPLLPQGSRGPVGQIARIVNRFMPFDR